MHNLHVHVYICKRRCSLWTGKVLHSVKYKDVVTNGMEGKRVLIIGIGNSAVDVAVNCASQGR